MAATESVIAPFYWAVAPDGYRWVDTMTLHGEQDRWLTDGRPIEAVRDYPQRRPMDEPALFRRFADLELAEQAVQKFANQWGLLGGTVNKEDTSECIRVGRPDDSHEDGMGERIQEWKKHVLDMRLAVTVWEALRAGDRETLERHVSVKVMPDQESRLHVTVWGQIQDHRTLVILGDDVAVGPDYAPQQRGQTLVPAGPEQAARWFVQGLVNARLAENVFPQVMPVAGYGADLRMQLLPKSLLGALWFQLARAIDGNREYRRCETCHNWFEVSLEVGRKDKRYCRDACKSKAWRDRDRKPAN